MSKQARQYTIRNVPASVDRALRRKATERRMSLNSLLLHALESEAGVAGVLPEHHDLDVFFGSWIADVKIDRALAEQRKIQPGEWD
jgi:hypothetical protein